jgi:methionyl-tRNA formyltransferase
LALKSFKWGTVAEKAYAYAQQRKLIILRRPLDDSKSIERLKSINCYVGLHAANVIYRELVISVFEMGILNAHIGILPKYRGRSVVEWSILQGDPTGVTVFFIDSGIDTGRRIILHKVIAAEGWNDVGRFKEMLFGSDARLYRIALEALMQPGFQFKDNNTSEGKRYYVMSKMFVEAVNEILSERDDRDEGNRQ